MYVHKETKFTVAAVVSMEDPNADGRLTVREAKKVLDDAGVEFKRTALTSRSIKSDADEFIWFDDTNMGPYGSVPVYSVMVELTPVGMAALGTEAQRPTGNILGFETVLAST